MQLILSILFATAFVLLLGLPAIFLPFTVQGLLRESLSGHVPSAWLLFGLLMGFMVYRLLQKGPRFRFFKVWMHEHAHLLMALILGTTPSSLSAGEESGLFRYRLSGPLPTAREFLISIAPYWFSPLLFSPLILLLIIESEASVVRFPLGILLGLALAMPPGEIHPRQTDLKRYGLVLPILAACWLWAATVSLSLLVVSNDSLGMVPRTYNIAWHIVRDLLS